VLARRCGVDGFGEFGGDGDGERVAGLLLAEVDGATADVAAPEPDDVGAAHRRPKQQRQGQPGLRADRVGRLERGDVLLGPGPIAGALGQFHTHASGGIALDDAGADRVPDKQPQAAQEVPSPDRRLGLGVEHAH
jgi:hypothetical protein